MENVSNLTDIALNGTEKALTAIEPSLYLGLTFEELMWKIIPPIVVLVFIFAWIRNEAWKPYRR